MPAIQSREIRLKSRPEGTPAAENFELASAESPSPGPGMVQVQNLWMSVDPYMRGRMYDRPSYVPPFQLGEALQGHAIGKVIESGDPDFQPGDIVSHMLGWREYVTGPKALFTKIDAAGIPLQAFLGVMGMPGMTAYCGFLEIGAPKPGETVFVSGAAGAVGSLVCQIAKIKGCKVVASCGSDEKAARLKSVGVDHVVNYKTAPDLLAAVRAAAPQGIDIYFDNVGGEHLEVALELARPGGRFAECGMISQYNATEPTPGPRNLVYIVGKSLKVQGFIVSNYASMQGQFLSEMGGWIKAGKIRWEETVMEGIAKAPEAFIGLFSGANAGKMLVKLA
ncbi:putative NADP-dependent oxidoreductase YfmJ [Candidatus Phycosocius bacilliformis]|uniref:Putative NADP-dependent oxidoreductase YfmJ n=1 Tax=Candidatus Phycosocius bacilliformis TaxID=1445552 RepID=A0A2P2E7K1_9PROT|nr:NADP-dependent oxidoreductase [Candidatus Phycosocius bacilliformis]GBF57039.1 putative NADP-dependent oxidoreductase YfmJ [Candidatus Phycosocius bacilliformis]